MQINLKDITKKGSKFTELKSYPKVMTEIKKEIENDLYDKIFIDRFVELSKIYNWTWLHQEINKNNVIDRMAENVYNILKKEIEYKRHHKEFKDTWVINYISSGRIVTFPTEFDVFDSKNIFIHFEFSCHL